MIRLENIRSATGVAVKDPSDARQWRLQRLGDAALVVKGEEILWHGPRAECPEEFRSAEVLDGRGRLVTPGLIDCHTHLIYGGDRSDEFNRRLQGESYVSIAASGGGILSTVRATRLLSEEELADLLTQRAQAWLRQGVTCVEVKSGYGLSLEEELKMLRAIARVQREFSGEMVSTFLGAHVVPPEFAGRREAYVDLICEEMIPQVAQTTLAEAVDVFCEGIGFTLEEANRVLQTAVNEGLHIKIHAEQLSDLGGARHAALQGALSCDHIEYLNPIDVPVLAHQGTVAVLLPGAFVYLGETQKPPVEVLRSQGVRMAVATDHNPGSSPLRSLCLAGTLACLHFGLTVDEVFLGMTAHAAAALGRSEQLGQLARGHKAHCALWSVEAADQLFYECGENRCSAALIGEEILEWTLNEERRT